MTTTKRPWYQEPFVWLLIAFPAAAVIGGFITLYLAISSNDGLVVDDYYKQGLAINRTLARDQAATRYGLNATVQFNTNNSWLFVTLNATQADYQLPQQIQLDFFHHTRSGFDHALILKRLSGNTYQGQLPELVVGEWYVQLTADDWRLLDSIVIPLKNHHLEIKPTA